MFKAGNFLVFEREKFYFSPFILPRNVNIKKEFINKKINNYKI